MTKLSIKSYQETLHQKTLKRLSINKRSRNSLSNIQPNAQSLCIFPSCEQVGWSPSSQSLPAMSDFHKNWLEQAQCINAFAKQKHVRNPERATVLSDRLLTSQWDFCNQSCWFHGKAFAFGIKNLKPLIILWLLQSKFH